MIDVLRRKAIALGFGAFAAWVRVRRRLSLLGRPRLLALDHVTLPVHDLDLARRFYCEVLGAAHFMTVDEKLFARIGRPFPPNGGEMAYHVSVYLDGKTRVELFLQRAGQPGPALGHPHYAFRATPRTIKTWKERLTARGIPVEGPLNIGLPGQASLYFNDPSGNRLEIMCLGYPEPIPERPPEAEKLTWDPRTVFGPQSAVT